MTHVVLVCQWYPPEPVEIPRSIALALRAHDHDVTVLTGVPNYPTGRVMKGHRALELRTERIDELLVRRTPLYPSHDASAPRRIANYVSWAVSASIFGQGALRAADVALVYSSPATAALPALVACTIWRTPYVLLIQDVWPDSIFASGFLRGAVGRVARKLLDRFVRWSYAKAEHIVVISPGMSDLLVSRGVPEDKISVVYNWVPEEDAATAERVDGSALWHPASKAGSSLASRIGMSGDARIFLYAGNHGHAQALDGLVQAFRDERTAPAHLVMLGSGIAKQQLLALADGHPRIHFLEPVDRATAAGLLAEASLSVVSLADEPLFTITMPSKVQSGLASGKPMLVIARGDAASVVETAAAGATATPGDLDAIIEAVRLLTTSASSDLDAMGSRGRHVYRSQMSRAVGAGRLSDLLTSASRCKRQGRHPAPTRRERRSA